MYSFLVLLPLTLITAAIGWLIIASPQIGEYVAYISTIEEQRNEGRLLWQIAAHVATYAITCFVLVAATRTISAPVSRDRSAVLSRIQLALEAIFVAVPSLVLVALAIKAMTVATGPTRWLLALAAVVAAAGLAASVAAVVLVKRPLEFFRSSLRPLSITKVDILGCIAFAASVTLAVSFMLRPVESASFLGIFPVLFMASTTALMLVAAIFAKGSSPVAILSTLVSGIVVLHAIDQLFPPREFRHRSEMPAGLQAKADAGLGVRDVTKARGIPELREAFRQWLEYRRPAIERYRSSNKAYPVFIVAAQGGGIYAAYHSALSLARLYDRCPEFAHHLFAISGVSGGSLGAAVFAELLRAMPGGPQSNPASASEGCNPQAGAPKLEQRVKAFFSTDFLSPVVDSALIFDVPSLLVPWLRFGLDRALALEYAFEIAWRRTGVQGKEKSGLTENFYGRWRPDGPAPALFLATTGVNYGIPVLVSQVRWSQNPRLGLRRTRTASADEEIKELLRRMLVQDERSRNSAIANILDFRPDLQLATSTAVALSGRFPYVTPPANIRSKPEIENTALHEKTDVLELLDGGMFDNSGGWIAIDMLEDLERYLRGRRRDDFKEFAGDIKFHLVRFTDRPAQRYGGASEEEHYELVTPLVAFNAVRLARGAQLRGVRDLETTDEHFVYLSDPWFQPPLNWVLGENTKRSIEVRSGGLGKAEGEVCCRRVMLPPRDPPDARSRPLKEIILVADWGDAQKLNDHPDAKDWRVEKFVPNNETAFGKLLDLVKNGDERAAAQK